jgi:uncharacterized membrane protein
MQVALIIIGTMLGFLAGSLVGGQWWPALLGAFAGYAVAEFRALFARNEQLAAELRGLKERLASVTRKLSEMEEGAAAASAQETVTSRVGDAETSRGPATADDLMSGSGGAASGADVTDAARADRRAGSTRAAGSADILREAPSSTGVRHSVAGAGTRGSLAPAGSQRLVREPETALREPETAVREPETVAVVSQEPARPGPTAVFAESPVIKALSEYFTGGNTLVRVGILILFFGVAFLLRYVAERSHVSMQVRLGAVACGGIALLALGWTLRAKRLGYALALQGGGVGILYLTTFAALRLYAALSPTTGFAVLVFLAAFSAVLAVWQSSQAFAFLAVTGGFLAPILASKGQGTHVVLFSYYLVLNASILAIAWYKAWRPLNFVGFAFTFLISGAWGVLHYNSGLFASTEPFLVLFFVFYVAIAILFASRQPPELKGYVDGTLVFGTPMAAFGYQSGMLYARPTLLAVSAIVVGAFYFILAWLLHGQRRNTQKLLVEAFIALGVVFLTVATPLALSGTATGVTWALEGAALIWVGARQDRAVPRVLGILLQIFSALIQIDDADGFIVVAAPPIGLYLARAVTAVAAVVSAVILRKYAQRLRPYERGFCPTLFFLGVAEWLFCGLLEIYRYAPFQYGLTWALVFVTLTALASSELSRRTPLILARLPALWLLPALAVFALLSLVPPVRHPFDYGGWLAWPLAFAGFYTICYRHEGPPNRALSSWLHVLSAWLLVALSSWQLAWFVDQRVGGHGSWYALAWMLIPAGSLWLLPRVMEPGRFMGARISWPVRAHREAYGVVATGGLAVYLALWSLDTNFTLPADPFPFPYVPLLNALDLSQVLVLVVLAQFRLYLRSTKPSAQEDLLLVAAVCALGFIWLNAALVRTLHRWAGVPFEVDAVIRSTLVQTSLSIFWTVLALATMLVATRRASRPAWLTGAVLLAVTIVKLFVIDLSRVGTVERIVSFVGVGLLTLVIGYFSPLPPAATSHRTTA